MFCTQAPLPSAIRPDLPHSDKQAAVHVSQERQPAPSVSGPRLVVPVLLILLRSETSRKMILGGDGSADYVELCRHGVRDVLQAFTGSWIATCK